MVENLLNLDCILKNLDFLKILKFFSMWGFSILDFSLSQKSQNKLFTATLFITNNKKWEKSKIVFKIIVHICIIWIQIININ